MASKVSTNTLINRATARLLKTTLPVPTPVAPKPAKKKSKKKSNLPKLPPSPMAVDFRHLKPTWRSYLDYVALAARDGDKDMAKYLVSYNQLSQREQLVHTPETLCDLSGVKPSDLFGSVCGQVWASSQREASMLIAINHPRIIEKTAKFAQQAKGVKDREMFHKGTGFLPTPKGAQISINNSPQMLQASGVGNPAALPSMEEDMMEIEEADLLPMLEGVCEPLASVGYQPPDDVDSTQAPDVSPLRHRGEDRR